MQVIVHRACFMEEVATVYIYPENLTAKPKLWFWTLQDIAILGIAGLVSILALAQTGFALPLVITFLYGFLSIRMEETSVLDYLRCAACFLFLKQQTFYWRLDP